MNVVLQKSAKNQLSAGMTVTEVLIVIAVIALLAAALLPQLARQSRRAPLVQCKNNLKQIGLGFKRWSLGSRDRFPMQASTNQEGSLEFASTGDVFAHFRAISNELMNPKCLVCPEDKDRVPSSRFDWGFSNSNVSYFVGLDACDTSPDMFLSGDRNITNNRSPLDGILELKTNSPIGWTTAIHNQRGNIALADCSVQTYDDTFRLRAALLSSGIPTNRLAMPIP